MTIGPVQLVVLGFERPNFHGEILAELARLRESDAVNVIDALLVYKDADGELEAEHLGNVSDDGTLEPDSKLGALIGLGFAGEDGAVVGAALGADFATHGGSLLSDEGDWDVLEDIPKDTAAALVLLEHHWAVPLRDAVIRTGGFRISDGFISALDLVAIGLVDAEEARPLHELESSKVPAG